MEIKEIQFISLKLLLCTFILGLSSCSIETNKEEEIILVRAEQVHYPKSNQFNSFSGQVTPSSEIRLAFRVSGTIKDIPVKVGDFVTKGSLLAAIDPRDYQLQFSATSGEYQQIKNQVERVKTLYKKKSTTKSNYEKAIYGLQQIQAKYNAHKNALRDTKLYAPSDGYIEEIFYNKEETIAKGLPFISIINTKDPEITISIPVSEYLQRDKFESFVGKVANQTTVEYPLELISISPKANINQLYTLKFRLKENQPNTPNLSAGIPITVSIFYKEEQKKGCYIPFSALFKHNGAYAIWTIDKFEKTTSLTPVEVLELNTDGSVLIQEQIPSNRLVITAGVHSLKEGQRVNILPNMKASNIGGIL